MLQVPILSVEVVSITAITWNGFYFFSYPTNTRKTNVEYQREEIDPCIAPYRYISWNIPIDTSVGISLSIRKLVYPPTPLSIHQLTYPYQFISWHIPIDKSVGIFLSIHQLTYLYWYISWHNPIDPHFI